MKQLHAKTDPDPSSILIVLPTWVGDFVMATPSLRTIRRRFPSARIVLLGEGNLTQLVDGGDWMDEFLAWPIKSRRKPWHREYRELVSRLRRERFDWAVLLPNSFKSALIAFLSGSKRRIGYDRDGRGAFLTDKLTPKNSEGRRFIPYPLVNYYGDLTEAIDCGRGGDRLELFTTPDCDASLQTKLNAQDPSGSGPMIAITPGAKFGAAKCWPAERFAQLADRLIDERLATVAISHGPGEEHLVDIIVKNMNRKAIVFNDPRLSLGEVKSLIKLSDLLICNDTGPRHFAKAFDIPVVTVFGPTHPEWTATSYTAERIVRIDVECGPCQEKICPLKHLDCMTGVTVDTVFHAACELLDNAKKNEHRKEGVELS